MRTIITALLVGMMCMGAKPARADDAVARGRYLATLGDCAVCHTGVGSGAQPYAGGYPLHARFGTVYSTNITPDKATGIGNWTADQFYRALHKGVAADGGHLYPAFPYPYFMIVSRADSDALFAYLRTLRPVRYTPPKDRLIFPTNIRMGMIFWNALFLGRHPPRPPEKSKAWQRGWEIVNGLGHCGGCHTPKTFFFSDENGKAFRGEATNGWFAANLTGSPSDGLGRWSIADIVQYLKTGGNRFGRVMGAMKDVVSHSTSMMTDADQNAIAVYLKSLPPSPQSTPSKPDTHAMENGQAIFAQRCSACHQEPGSKDYPSLVGNSIVEAHNPETMLRVIVQGSQSASTPNGPVGFSMPAFPVLQDQDLADVATYVRNAWGNRAQQVTAKEAAAYREAFKGRI